MGERATDGADAMVRMRHAIAAATAGSGSTDDLQAAARALVSGLRDRDEPPEQMLIEIKAILSSAGLSPESPPDAAGFTDRSASVYRDVIAWSIRAYYEER